MKSLMNVGVSYQMSFKDILSNIILENNFQFRKPEKKLDLMNTESVTLTQSGVPF